MALHDRLSEAVQKWRAEGYPASYPVREILAYAHTDKETLRYLRQPQFEALETYWYLRLVLKTPRLSALYDALFENRADKLDALGISITHSEVARALANSEDLVQKILTDDAFAKALSADALRESLSLAYPSYIFALTMGAGKTALIGAIIATEFALALQYQGGPFMKNALVFAPGKTILDSLRQIATLPFEDIIPPRFLSEFLPNVKLIYTTDGDPDIPVVEGGSFNIVVTNSEKITLRKMNKRAGQSPFDFEAKEEREKLFANRRLQKIASLPSLGVFSDEAHHTYGNALGAELGRARSTIDHIANETNLVCVVNTTGTPYYQRQFLRDVVCWYGLAEGIRDNILKSVENRVIAYDFSEQSENEVVAEVVRDFLKEYGSIALPTGQRAKIAFYFRTQEHLEESKRVIEEELAKLKIPAGVVLVNTQKSTKDEEDEFRRLNDPESQKRVILLVGRGTEGWDCPSLFATALVRQQTDAGTFVLQAATRCLRQVPGNREPGSIYLESHNRQILEKQLEENFGIGIDALTRTPAEYDEKKLVVRKRAYPRLVITERIRSVVRKKGAKTSTPTLLAALQRPKPSAKPAIYRAAFSLVLERSAQALLPSGATTLIQSEEMSHSLFEAAEHLARSYRLPYGIIFARLAELYKKNDIPRADLAGLSDQLDTAHAEYETREETLTRVLAILRFVDDKGNDTFATDEAGALCYTIRFRKAEPPLFLAAEDAAHDARGYGFHYSPYTFDSAPEKEFLETMLAKLNGIKKETIADIYFTGGLTDRKYTDIHFEYKGADGVYHAYYPDFVIAKKDGSFYIVEIKREGGLHEIDVLEKKKAVERLANMPANRFKYQVIETGTPIPASKYRELDQWV